MIQEKPATRARAPMREGPGTRAPAHARSGVPDVIGAADGRQGKSRAGSGRVCRSRVSCSGRKLGRPAREPGRAADSAVHHAAETRHE